MQLKVSVLIRRNRLEQAMLPNNWKHRSNVVACRRQDRKRSAGYAQSLAEAGAAGNSARIYRATIAATQYD